MRKQMIIYFLPLLMLISLIEVYGQPDTGEIRHVKVYHEPGRFGGWPANHGIWIWENEILVGFSKGYYKDLGPDRHNIDREKTELHMLARSLDGGETWQMEDPGKQGALVLPDNGVYHGQPRTDVQPQPLMDSQGGIDFTHPDFALTVRTDNIHAGQSRYWYSYDRGHQWKGTYRLPNFEAPGTAARTDYIVNSRQDCMLFLTAAKTNGKEGRTMCVQTKDGGKNWNFVSWIGPEPEGFSIMPASVRLSENEILVLTRRREADRRFIAAYCSDDNGHTWHYRNNPVEDTGEGNPPALIQLQDGRLCVVYGYRAAPYSIRAKISNDEGKTWSRDYILRADGSGRDIGYPRVVQRPDGKVVVVYYFMDEKTGPERYIGATIWTPPTIEEN